MSPSGRSPNSDGMPVLHEQARLPIPRLRGQLDFICLSCGRVFRNHYDVEAHVKHCGCKIHPEGIK
jgi:hypothetical protein